MAITERVVMILDIRIQGKNTLAEVLAAWRQYCGDELLTGKELAESEDLDSTVSATIVEITRQESMTKVRDR